MTSASSLFVLVSLLAADPARPRRDRVVPIASRYQRRLGPPLELWEWNGASWAAGSAGRVIHGIK